MATLETIARRAAKMALRLLVTVLALATASAEKRKLKKRQLEHDFVGHPYEIWLKLCTDSPGKQSLRKGLLLGPDAVF